MVASWSRRFGSLWDNRSRSGFIPRDCWSAAQRTRAAHNLRPRIADRSPSAAISSTVLFVRPRGAARKSDANAAECSGVLLRPSARSSAGSASSPKFPSASRAQECTISLGSSTALSSAAMAGGLTDTDDTNSFRGHRSRPLIPATDSLCQCGQRGPAVRSHAADSTDRAHALPLV